MALTADEAKKELGKMHEIRILLGATIFTSPLGFGISSFFSTILRIVIHSIPEEAREGLLWVHIFWFFGLGLKLIPIVGIFGSLPDMLMVHEVEQRLRKIVEEAS